MMSAEEPATARSARLTRVLRWLDEVAAGRAARQVRGPGGTFYLDPDFTIAHSQNFMRLEDAPPVDLSASALDSAAQAVFREAGVEHRVIEIADAALATRLEPGLVQLGYHREMDLLMTYSGGGASAETAGEVAVDVAVEVVEMSLAERMVVASTWRRAENPDWPEDHVRQLGQRIRTIVPVVAAVFLGVRVEGEIVARTDLYVRDAVAQVEEVVTLASARNRGYASALVRSAVGRGLEAGADLVFLIADPDDRPAALYRRLGFEDLATTSSFINSPYT